MVETIIFTLVIIATITSVANYIYRLFKSSAINAGDNCEPIKCEYCGDSSGCKDLINIKKTEKIDTN